MCGRGSVGEVCLFANPPMAHRSSPRSKCSASGPEAPPAPPAARRVGEGQPPRHIVFDLCTGSLP
eukprot:5199438-Pyramimonas_sp.AAC.1